jgi:hypothetical protein
MKVINHEHDSENDPCVFCHETICPSCVDKHKRKCWPRQREPFGAWRQRTGRAAKVVRGVPF